MIALPFIGRVEPTNLFKFIGGFTHPTEGPSWQKE